MKKLAKLLLVITLITMGNMYTVNASENYEINSKIDIINKISEVRLEKEKLSEELRYIEETINKKEAYIDENSNSKIIQLSFIDSNIDNNYIDLDFSIQNELEQLIETKESLETNIEKLVIEEVRLEKSISQYMTIGCWPVPGFKNISSYFGYRIHPITNEKKIHKGIDIPATTGVDIVATDDGIVKFSGVQNGYGNVIEIEHFGGKTSKYAHNSENLVNIGDIVQKGDTIAKIGSTGRSTGPHVHFEVLINGEAKDPLEMIEN